MIADRINPIFSLALSTFPDDNVLFPVCFYLVYELRGLWVCLLGFLNSSLEAPAHPGVEFITLKVCIVCLSIFLHSITETKG